MHIPEGWTHRHLHLNDRITNYSKFYFDRTVTINTERGADDNALNGLEGSQLLFYAGHGTPGSFHALRNQDIDLGNFSLGDGEVRYLWMLSCQVFAHGPRAASGNHTYQDFVRPDKFDPAASLADPANHPNVFDRWTRDYGGGRSPLNPGLRLACGGSSHIGDIDHPTHLVWHYYTNLGLGPADSFLLGLYKPESFGIPLCMSRGGDTPENSSLYDARFVADRPPPNQPAVYIEYPVPGDGSNPLTAAAIEAGLRLAPQPQGRTDEPTGLPVLIVKEAPPPAFLDSETLSHAPFLGYGFKGASAKALGVNFDVPFPSIEPLEGANFLSGDDICIKRQSKTGAMVFSLQSQMQLQGLPKSAQWKTLENLSRLVLSRILKGEEPKPPMAPEARLVLRDAQPVEMHVGRVLVSNLSGAALQRADITDDIKCVYLRLSRVYEIAAGVEAPILGEGGEVLFRLCPPRLETEEAPFPVDVCRPDRAPALAFSYGNRKITNTRADSPKTKSEAQKDAWEKLISLREKASDIYEPEPDSYHWGYRASPTHCKQDEMYIVYEFVFVPKPDVALQGFGPVTIEVPAQSLPENAKSIEDTWKCSPEQED